MRGPDSEEGRQARAREGFLFAHKSSKTQKRIEESGREECERPRSKSREGEIGREGENEKRVAEFNKEVGLKFGCCLFIRGKKEVRARKKKKWKRTRETSW